MKNLLAALVLCSVMYSVSHGQITLEHTFPTSAFIQTIEAVTDAEYKYIGYAKTGRVVLHNLDHSLYKDISVAPAGPKPTGGGYSFMGYATRNLFNNDNLIEYLVSGFNASGKPFIRVYNENGDSLFICDDCQTPFSATLDFDGINAMIFNTPQGTKMLIAHSGAGTDLYTLPGKLPTIAKVGVIDPPSIISGNSHPTSAYPNPTSGKVRIKYTLPEGVTTGELVITSSNGKELKRYKVSDTFNDLLIERSELRSGVYFYKLITTQGESDAKKLVVTR